MKMKKICLVLALLCCLCLMSACTMHVDRDPWPSNEQTAATAQPTADTAQDAVTTDAPQTATPDPAVTPLPTVDPNASSCNRAPCRWEEVS